MSEIKLLELAEFFGISERSISRYKNSDDTKDVSKYKAFKAFYVKNVSNANKTALQVAIFELKECISLIEKLDASQGDKIDNTI